MPQLVGPPALAATAHFDVAGFRLRASAEAADLLAPVRRLMGSFEVDSTTDSAHSAWRLRIHREDSVQLGEPGCELRRVWSGEVSPGLRAVNYVGSGRRRFCLSDHSWMDLDATGGKASIFLSPDSPTPRVSYFATLLMCEGLIAAGHCLLHAACLAVPVRGRRQSVLIVAKGGTGKSTTALALAAAGWELMGDDIALVVRSGGRIHAWGFPRACHVRRPTLQLLPWLNELPLTPTAREGTFDLPLAALGVRSEQSRPRPLEPALIICLDQPNGIEHRLSSLDRAAALLHVAEENVQPNEGPSDAAAQRAFNTIAELVQQAPACRLSVGPLLDQLAPFLSRHLNG